MGSRDRLDAGWSVRSNDGHEDGVDVILTFLMVGAKMERIRM